MFARVSRASAHNTATAGVRVWPLAMRRSLGLARGETASTMHLVPVATCRPSCPSVPIVGRRWMSLSATFTMVLPSTTADHNTARSSVLHTSSQYRCLSTARVWRAKCHYDVLGVKSTATAGEIKEVWRIIVSSFLCIPSTSPHDCKPEAVCLLCAASHAISPSLIAQAYRQLAKQMHPDKMHDASVEEQTAAHHRFVEINAAFTILGDLANRRR